MELLFLSLEELTNDINTNERWNSNMLYRKLKPTPYRTYIELCEKIIELGKDIKLKKNTGPFRTMYKIEYLLFWYFEDKMKNIFSKEKKEIYNRMRHTLLVINKKLNIEEKKLKNIEKQKKLIKQEEKRKKIKSIKKIISETPIRRSNRTNNKKYSK